MTKRLSLGDNPLTFKLSIPSVNVDVATYDQLLFDISLGRSVGIHLAGSFLTTQMTQVSGTAATGVRRFRVNLTRSFDVPPQVFIAAYDPAYSNAAWTNDGHLMPTYNRSVDLNDGVVRWAFIRIFPKSTYVDIELNTYFCNWILPTNFYYCIASV